MDTDPPQPRENIVHRAEQAAEHAEQHLPSWLRPGDPESRWPVLLALVAAIVFQRLIPEPYTVVPRWPLISLEIALVVVLLALNPVRFTRSTVIGKYASWVLLAAIAVDNTLSAINLDRKILSGPDLTQDGRRPRNWTLKRDPYLLETNVPGIFVAGDVRRGSIKRVASAVGEGSIAIELIHQYLNRF